MRMPIARPTSFYRTSRENFRHDGTIREKYNVVTRSSEAKVATGYQINVVGFGWTNAAFLVLLHKLPAEMVTRLANEQTHSRKESVRSKGWLTADRRTEGPAADGEIE